MSYAQATRFAAAERCFRLPLYRSFCWGRTHLSRLIRRIRSIRICEAGEFGPALAAAKGLPDQALRDELLGKIAAAQAAAGASEGSLGTAAENSERSGPPGRAERRRRSRRNVRPRVGWSWWRRAGRLRFADRPDHHHHFAPNRGTMWAAPARSRNSTAASRSIRGPDEEAAADTDRSLAMTRRAGCRLCSPPAIRGKSSALRKISLTRLEREVQMLHALGRAAGRGDAQRWPACSESSTS